MDFLIAAFNAFLYKPLFNALILFYEYLPGHDFGVAIIALTLLIRLVLYPLMAQSIRAQKTMAEIQPKIQELQKKYKEDKERQMKEVLAAYKQANISPFGSLVPVLVQFPILIALYRVFWKGAQLTDLSAFLYGFVPNPGTINQLFLGLIDLSKASLALAVLAGIFQFFQAKMLTPPSKKQNIGKQDDQTAQFSNIMQKQMLYFVPVFTVFILAGLPAAIGIYWITTAAFSIVQQKIILQARSKI